jgi:DNA-binding NtrC family response regulator
MSHPDDDLLLIEDNHADGKLGRETLTDKRFGPFQIEWTKNLSDALERLNKGGMKAVAADLFLGDSQGIEEPR